MTTLTTTLKDDAARRAALTDRQHGLLVEAGAGSGKTAILAGRVALLIADGVPPREIAAITFTELAAAELAARVRTYVESLAAGEVPTTLMVAFPSGAPSAQQRGALSAALSHLDELTCSTIHGFARELVRPYPVEADIDPGAGVLDGAEQQLLFDEVFDAWLRERLGEKRPPAASVASGEAQGASRPPEGEDIDVLVELVTHDEGMRLEDLKELASLVHDRRAEPGEADLAPALANVRALAKRFVGAVEAAPGAEGAIGEGLQQLRDLTALLGAVTPDVRGALSLLTGERPTPLFTKGGTLRVLRAKGKWRDAGVGAGLTKAAAEGEYEAAAAIHGQLGEALAELFGEAADTLLQALVAELAEVGSRYRERKRSTAALDFDDLIFTALTLLRDHPAVRDDLADRYRHVLIDEFQDTDPSQAEIVWRLTGEPTGGDWRAWPTRPGARFVVGDPKQSIYRFRGADARTYRLLSDGLAADPGAKVLELSTNFRSTSGILGCANATFVAPLSEEGQPGYRPLNAFRDGNGATAVQRLLVPGPHGEGANTSVGEHREAEAAAVAQLVLGLIDGSSGLLPGPVAAGDIALLAPVGSGLEVYERALDECGLSVASQAGKGFYRRQEVQDLVALTRALADPRDRLALGALLRGPLVGATDEELLDATHALTHLEGDERYLNLSTDTALLPSGVVRGALERLAPLLPERFATTPHALLSRALDALQVRAVLEHRHGSRAGRALANVDRFLERSRAYDVRGLTAFANDVWASWADLERELEGRADSEENAVTLITVHSAKGLEWKVVIPVNTASKQQSVTGALFDRERQRVAAKVLGQECSGYGRVKEREEAELRAERIRLWYVAATRAEELLVVPEHAGKVSSRAWCTLIDWLPEGLPELEPEQASAPPRRGAAHTSAAQSREQFLAEQRSIERSLARLERRAPSRRDDQPVGPAAGADDEAGAVVTLTDEAATTILTALDEEEVGPAQAAPLLEVGAARGILLHKLLEEVVNGEAEADLAPLAARAELLASQLHVEEGAVDPREVAELSLRAWTLPEVAALHGRLVAEVEVAGVEEGAGEEGATVLWGGIADAIALSEAGEPEVVIDWKSDRDPSEATILHYREQLLAYLKLTGAREGMLVLATPGRVTRVARD